VILRTASRVVAISILILLLLIANHHLNSQSKEITYSYVVILSPNGTPAKSEEFINSLSSFGDFSQLFIYISKDWSWSNNKPNTESGGID